MIRIYVTKSAETCECTEDGYGYSYMGLGNGLGDLSNFEGSNHLDEMR